jgi:putative oxidoreductase
MFTKLLNTDLSKAPVDLAILLLRLVSGAFIITHGAPKVTKILSSDMGFADPIGLGPEISLVLTAFAEVVCGFLVAVGLATRWATIPLIIAMAVAGLIHHAADPFGGKEKPLLFLVIFVVLLLTGGGKYSLDRKLSKS